MKQARNMVMVGFMFFRDKNLSVTPKPRAVMYFGELLWNERITGA